MILTDDVVERVARGIYESSHNLSNCYSWEDEWEPHQRHHRERYYRDARAALEAARYGEMRECLMNLVDAGEQRRVEEFDPASRVTVLETRTKDILSFHEALDEARALLSTIGEPNPDSGGV